MLEDESSAATSAKELKARDASPKEAMRYVYRQLKDGDFRFHLIPNLSI